MFKRSCLLIAGLIIPALGFAHANLLIPIPRVSQTLKTGPCGGIARTTRPAVYETGATIEVTWEETTDHPGYFRILFSKSSDTNFLVLLDNIADKKIPLGMSKIGYSAMVTLPSEPCEAGTLQLIQVMTESPTNPSLYFSCADVCLVPAGSPKFMRGDSNSDGAADLTDAVAILFDLFVTGESPACADAADANDDGTVNLADPTVLLRYLFLKAAPPPSPGALVCGPDPTGDELPECVPVCP